MGIYSQSLSLFDDVSESFLEVVDGLVSPPVTNCPTALVEETGSTQVSLDAYTSPRLACS